MWWVREEKASRMWMVWSTAGTLVEDVTGSSKAGIKESVPSWLGDIHRGWSGFLVVDWDGRLRGGLMVCQCV
jgi:hypothetical protein